MSEPVVGAPAVSEPAVSEPAVSETATDRDVSKHSRGITSTSNLLLVRRVVVTLASALATSLIARRLSTDAFGVYSAALATYYLASSFTDLGFGLVLGRELGLRPDERPMLLRAAMRPAGLWAVVVATVLAVTALGTSGTRAECLLVLTPPIALAGVGLARQLFIVEYDVRVVTSIDTVVNLVQVVTLILIAELGGGPVALSLATSLTSVANVLLVAAVAARRVGPGRPSWAQSRELVRMSLPLGVISVMASAYFSIDLVIAGYVLPPHAVALYAAAVRVLTIVTVLPSLLLSVALPGLAAVSSSEDPSATGALLARVWHLLLTEAGVVCVGFAVFAGPSVRILFGAGFDAAAAPLRVLMAAGGVALLSNIFGMVLIARRRATITFAQNVVANVTLNLLLLPRFGIMAAAWLTLATEVFIAGCGALILRNSLDWRPIARLSRIPLLAMAVGAGLGVLPMPEPARLVAAGVGFFGVMWTLRGWPHELARWGGVWLSRPGAGVDPEVVIESKELGHA